LELNEKRKLVYCTPTLSYRKENFMNLLKQLSIWWIRLWKKENEVKHCEVKKSIKRKQTNKSVTYLYTDILKGGRHNKIGYLPKILVGKCKEKGLKTRRLNDNIIILLREMCCDYVRWIQLSQVIQQLQASLRSYEPWDFIKSGIILNN
jgi:hypothetical protein